MPTNEKTPEKSLEEELQALEEQAKREPRKPNTPLLCIFLILFASVLPLMILYAGNPTMRYFEFLLPSAILIAVAVILFFIGWAIFRKPLFAALLSATLILLAMNYHLLRFLFEQFTEAPYTHLFALGTWLVLLAAVLLLFIRFRNVRILPQLAQIFCIVLAVLIAYNAVKVAPDWVSSYQLDSMPSQSPAEGPVYVSEEEMRSHTVEENGRNLYWILLDEYADAYTMAQYFDVDSAPFVSFLTENGFSVSQKSCSNSNNSTVCARDAAMLRYYSDEQREMLLRNNAVDNVGEQARRDGELFTALHSLGYQVYQVSSHPAHYAAVKELLPQPLSEQLLCSTTVDGLSILDLTREMSVVSAFTELFPSGKTGDDNTLSARLFNESFRSRVLRVFQYYDDPKNLCFRDKTALFSYVLCPHTPFVFRADGSEVSSVYRRDWDDPSHYAEQHQYMTVCAQRMIENILAVDSDAVIILQSDHGVRGGWFVGHGIEIEQADQLRIFNAVYFGGEEIDIDGLSAVNTLRYVFTRLGADYPLLDDANVRPYYNQDTGVQSGQD